MKSITLILFILIVTCITFCFNIDKSDEAENASNYNVTAWQINSGKSKTFLVGTVSNLPVSGDLNFEYQYKKIFKEADLIHLINYQILVDNNSPKLNDTLAVSLLSNEVNDSLKMLLEKMNYPKYLFDDNISRVLPYRMLSFNSLLKSSIDYHYTNFAERDQKEISYYDTLYNLLDDQSKVSNYNELILYYIEYILSYNNNSQEIRDAWKNGNIEYLDLVLNSCLHKHPDVKKNVHQERVNRYVSHILSNFKDDKVKMYFVPVEYLVGKNGIISKISEKRIKVAQVQVVPVNRHHQYILENDGIL